MLRAVVPLLTFLIASGATAQVVSPIEQSYGPYARPAEGFGPSLAISRHAILLAWSEIISPGEHARIRIGLLDFHGRLVAPITTIETGDSAVFPKVTTDGTSFRVEYDHAGYTFGVDVDARGTVIGSPQRTARTPSAFVSRWDPPPPTWCWPPCATPDPFWTLRWSFLGNSGSHVHNKKEVLGSAGAGGTPNHFAIAWNTPSGVSFVEYLDGVRKAAGVLIPVAVNTWEAPAVACDDTHCLIAFTTPVREIYGVLIDPARPHLLIPVAIETASRVEKPQIHLVHNGRFLVTYVSADDERLHRFAGRIVTTAPQPRRRAVR